MKKTQKSIVKDILQRDGKINNYSVIDSRLSTRLGAIIHLLRSEGWEIEGGFIKGTRNFEYRVVSAPKKPVIYITDPRTGNRISTEEYNKQYA